MGGEENLQIKNIKRHCMGLIQIWIGTNSKKKNDILDDMRLFEDLYASWTCFKM